MGIELGQVVDGKYRVTACIGVGGMGAVYAGEHLKLHRKVAIKVLHASVASDPEVVSRFEREAQAAGRIGNDHILEVFDIGEFPGGDRYMVMEFLEGEPMNARLSRLGPVEPRQIYPLVRQILEGLAAAHSAGIIHRDLKPANIFILREKAGLPDYVKIIDFGISKFQNLAGDAAHHETRTGTIIGTPSYMSPEQARGLREADGRSDIYAAGVILYESVTGRCPFEGSSTHDLLFKIFLNEPTPIETIVQGVDPAFCTIIMKALAKEPGDRFARAEDFIAALDAWAQTGRGVTLSKPSAMATSLIEPPLTAPPPFRDVRTPHPSTQGAWADFRSGAARGPRGGGARAIVIVPVIAVLALVGGGVVLGTRRGGHYVDAAASGAAPLTASAPPLPAAPVDTSTHAPSTPPPSAGTATGAASAPAPTPSAAPPISSASSPARPSTRPPKPAQPRPPAAPTNPFEER